MRAPKSLDRVELKGALKMFSRTDARFGCPEYQADLEDALREGQACVEPGSRLEIHLRGCAGCRQALTDALGASELMRHARYPEPAVSPALVTRVMASIREATEAAPATIWRPLELLASRMALAAAVVLLVMSVYLREITPTRATAPVTAPAEVGAVLPEPPAQPANADEVLMSLADSSDSI
jgi:predicted anti-sigma-YlaC factor YlaD